jgi:predicted amidohydrolase
VVIYQLLQLVFMMMWSLKASNVLKAVLNLPIFVMGVEICTDLNFPRFFMKLMKLLDFFFVST